MTPEDALTLLENATGLLQLNRDDHAKITLALSTLRTTVMVQSKQKENKN